MKSDGAIVAITGANGFIGRNLMVRLGELGYATRPLTRESPAAAAQAALSAADVVFHLAGAVRPADPSDFTVSRQYTDQVAEAIAEGGKRPRVIFSSSSLAGEDNDYGRSKLAGEQTFLNLADAGLATVAIYRLPNVFGKWARPNYNSMVATFCHNLARGLSIRIDAPEVPLSLVYVDDLVDQWCGLLSEPLRRSGFVETRSAYRTTVGELATSIEAFAAGRLLGEIEDVGVGLRRALYSTFISALPTEAFGYPLTPHTDARGAFAEVLKTRASGQFSFFTANPGVTRGGHYHHSKIEKFLVVHGQARFRFRHILSGETTELHTRGDQPVVVETIPGWTHDITNTGDGAMVCLLWANEVFDRNRPDTVAMDV